MKPTNNHLKIQPVVHDSFVTSQQGVYQEIGVVLDIAEDLEATNIPIGAKVYFDSWLAKKYPVEGKEDEYVWFVNHQDIVAYEPISK